MPQSRLGEFNTGINSGPQEPASLQQRAQRFNELNPGKFKPNALNQQLIPSSNGMSDKDAQRITPYGMLAGDNGMSADTYSKVIPKYGMSLSL